MGIQIIFFASVVLVIALLVNRARRTGVSPNRPQGSITRTVTGLTVFVIGVTKRFGTYLNSRLFNRNKQEKIPFSSPDQKVGFWKKEHSALEYDLLSHLEEGETLQKQGKLQEAEQFYLKAAANNPSDSKVYAKLGLLYLQQDNYSDAIESLKIAVKFDKHNPSRHYNLALAYWGNKDVQRATAAIREAISLDPVTKKYRQLLEQLLNRQQKQ